ncbi:MAG: sulfite exporter TauE/SafE family protein [Syntrophales bacterium]|jgi:uncharacterized membrane protein YfcA|nr:sulfite exporter TauE/SafE family protein [Syntrophales bacterium]MDY0045433.1 sulfite exporter TauE/SafE family protein [Syntrophales bacterium]
MIHLNMTGWILVIFCAIMTGFSKAGIMGAGAVVAPILASIMPARESTGFLLPMLIIGDLTATIYWRRHAKWSKLAGLIPWTLIGVILGWLWLGKISDRHLMAVIGAIVLILVVLHQWQQRRPDFTEHIPHSRWFASIMGILAGATSMLANAAGPILVIYLLAMKLEKSSFIGTAAIFFLILNVSKMPFSANLDLVTKSSLLSNLAAAPFIIIGAILGIVAVQRIPQRFFDRIMQCATAAMAVYLCVKAMF